MAGLRVFCGMVADEMSASKSTAEDPAFAAFLGERNTDELYLGATLIAIFTPLFWVLDWYVIPKHVIASFTMRMFCTFSALVSILLIRRARTFARRHVSILCMICGMNRLTMLALSFDNLILDRVFGALLKRQGLCSL